VIEKKTAFYSEGLRLTASLYHPDVMTDDGPHPAVIIASGYQGFNEFYPKMFARALTRHGYVCFGFDYRGFADSEGEKGRVLIDEQIADLRNAISFVRSRDEVDQRRLGLIGWGMGAANSIIAAERSREVAAVAALNGFYNGARWLQAVHPYDEWMKLVDAVAEDRVQRVLTGESRLGETFEHYPLDPMTKEYVGAELAGVYGFGHPTRIQFTESIIDLDAERAAPHLRGTPLFIGHGVRNALHPFSEAEHLFAAAESPKTLYRIDGRHNDFMYSDDPVFTALCGRLTEFFDDAFAADGDQGVTVA